jgi:GNAT superfamily N-acetyltransferase
MIVTSIKSNDAERWIDLWRAYLDFYETVLPRAVYEYTWKRIMTEGAVLQGLGARLTEDGPLMGITHYLTHESGWNTRKSCYLQDLFVDPSCRGQGVARQLIEAVADKAKKLDCTKVYWLTSQDNTPARALYDKIAKFEGFIRYDYSLS